jgi:hypothetical protein
MMGRRSYIAEGELQSGCGVVQGSNETKVKAPGEGGAGDFIGVYAYESNEAKQDGEPVGIVIDGPCKILAGGSVTAGKKAVLRGDTSGSFINCPTSAGRYSTCGTFLQSGLDGEYVDMMVERGSVTITA